MEVPFRVGVEVNNPVSVPVERTDTLAEVYRKAFGERRAEQSRETGIN